ncbi:MAG: hypothetical protein HQ539_01635 [Parcubacteria group bacterium]|nr:hypothetical protein [Parcubacteria group bacterium]
MRKILDIVPQGLISLEQTKKKKKKGEMIKKTQKGQETKKKKSQANKNSKIKGLFPFPGLIYVLAGLIVVSAVIFVVFTLKSKLTLTLYFAQEELVITDEIEVNTIQTEVDTESKIIPGRFFELEKEKWEIFPATGKSDANQKSEGIVKVYNSHNPTRPVILVAQTRLLSSGAGKIYRAQEKIYLPPATIKSGKVIPSVTDIKVIAQEAGEDYNIEPATFSVPGLAGSALYYTIWAESEESMKGGSKEEVLQITDDDLRDAKLALTKILENSSTEFLKKKIPTGFILDDGAIIEEDIETTCFKEAGVISPDFNCYGKIKTKGLAFKTEDLKNVVLSLIELIKPSSKELRDESLETSFSPNGAVLKAGKMILSVSSKASVFEQINEDVLFYQIYGKNAEQVRVAILDNFPQIEKIELKFWPFWMKKAPKDIEKIKINLTF